MRFRRRKRVPDSEGLARARRARIDSEHKLRDALANVIEPLRELREENHITEDVRTLIERKVKGN